MVIVSIDYMRNTSNDQLNALGHYLKTKKISWVLGRTRHLIRRGCLLGKYIKTISIRKANFLQKIPYKIDYKNPFPFAQICTQF